jgi:hypothetical protein
MAKGNMGNLAQHFVAIHSINQLVLRWNQPEAAIELIDCYSMAPWETLETSKTPQRRLFENRCRLFEHADDCQIADSFNQAWRNHYGRVVPIDVSDRMYPNTAVLLKAAFPNQRFRMRLHDNDGENFDQLKRLAYVIGPDEVQVDRDWTQSRLIHGVPAPKDRPVALMLDPYKIVPNDHDRVSEAGYLTPRHIQYLLGPSALAIDSPRKTPCVMIACSYSEQSPEASIGILTGVLANTGWSIETLVAGPFPDIGRTKSHVIVVASMGCEKPIFDRPLQDMWNEWLNVPGGVT